jgi:hypothetical protein
MGGLSHRAGGKSMLPELWLWVAVDADSKLVPSWRLGQRDLVTAADFVNDLAKRVKGAYSNHYGCSANLPNCHRRCLRFGSRFCPVAQSLSCSNGKRDALFPRKVHWLLDKRCERKPGPEAYLYVLRGAPEVDGADNHAALHSLVQRVFAQAGKSRGGGRAKLFRLQLHQN